MKFDTTQIFLLLWITAFWGFYILTYGKVEGKHETSMREKFRLKPRWSRFFGWVFMGWTLIILVNFFFENSANWFLKLSFLDIAAVQIAAIVLLCIAFSFNLLFVNSVGKSIESAYGSGVSPQLVTSGIYGIIRHPGYLSYFVLALCCFLLIPNLLTLLFMIFSFVVIYNHTLEEENKLVLLYGEPYRDYMNSVGRYFPKIK